MPNQTPPLILINAVALTGRLLETAPRLSLLAKNGSARPLKEVIPAVTCTAQASLLTGETPQKHGIVANGWLFRDTGEVRFWQQSNALIQSEPLYIAARRERQKQGLPFKVAKLFWWFNQGAAVDISVTPKPYYAADGNKAFGIAGTPNGLTESLERELGTFPFHTFWGPNSGLPCTAWIARCGRRNSSERTSRPHACLSSSSRLRPTPVRPFRQRSSSSGSRTRRRLRRSWTRRKPQARVWVVSEYGHVNVKRAVEPNRLLRRAGLLEARLGPFGETLNTFQSRAFAVCDHQIAHVYVKDREDQIRVRDVLIGDSGVDRVWIGAERAEIGLDHPRSGELVALSKSDAWFAYPFWLDDRAARLRPHGGHPSQARFRHM